MKLSIQHLLWDSDFFNMKVGKLLIDKNTFFNINELKSQIDEYDVIYIFSDKAIEGLDSILYDIKVTWQLKVDGTFVNYDSKQIAEHFCKKKHRYADLEYLAMESGIFSRFNKDKNFGQKRFNSLYNQWIQNALSNENENSVQVVMSNTTSAIDGFITIEKSCPISSNIGLISVHADARGKGVASILINTSIKIALEKGSKLLKVVTQENNIPAMNLYRKNRFEIINRQYVYHLWKQ